MPGLFLWAMPENRPPNPAGPGLGNAQIAPQIPGMNAAAPIITDPATLPAPLLNEAEKAELERAVRLLERTSLPVRLAHLIGAPLEGLSRALPKGARDTIQVASDKALRFAFNAALASLGRERAEGRLGLSGWGWLDDALSSDWSAKASVLLTGSAGGAAGLAGTAVELPITTTLILRSIAQIGQMEGEDVSTEDFKIACLSVLAMGGPDIGDDAAESGYFAIRLAVAETIKSAAGKSLAELLPAILLTIAKKFGAAATLKFSAQMAPLVGGIAGATINYVFIDHFQDKARGHFTLRRLERRHGQDAIKAAYQAERERGA